MLKNIFLISEDLLDMKLRTFSAAAALSALAAATALMAPAVHAGSVTVNGTATCSDAPTISMTPAGDLTLTCTPVGGGGSTTPPVCSVVPSGTQNVTQGGQLTLSASCNPAATSWSWTSTGLGAPAMGVTPSATLTFTNSGTFGYQ